VRHAEAQFIPAMRLLACGILLLGHVAPASAQTFLLISGGGKDPAAGEKALAQARSEMATSKGQVELEDSYPRLLHSDDAPGLNPGFFVSVLGACANRETAERARDALHRLMPGVYLRATSAPVAEGCPWVAGKPAQPLGGTTITVQELAVPHYPGLRLRLMAGDSSPRCEAEALWVELVRGDVIWSRASYRGECTQGVHSLQSWSGHAFVSQGLAVAPVGVTSESDGEHGSTVFHLVAACEGSLRETREVLTCGWGANSRCALTAMDEGPALHLLGENSWCTVKTDAGGEPCPEARLRRVGCVFTAIPEPSGR
jgi:hypothetical protein